MPARRRKSLLYGSAPDTTIYHREHRSKKKRSVFDVKKHKSPAFKKKVEKIKKYENSRNLGGV